MNRNNEMEEEGQGIPPGSSPLLFASMLPGVHPATNSALFSETTKYIELRDLLFPINLIIMVSRINKQTQSLAKEAVVP